MKKLKRTAAGMTAALMLGMSCAALAADNISVVLNGAKVSFPNAKPVIYEDRTLIPVRAVFEELGCYVDWDSANRMAVIGNDEKTILIPIDSKSMQLYDIATDTSSDIKLDVPAMIINDSTMIPLRAVGEALGAKVDWRQETKTVLINMD